MQSIVADYAVSDDVQYIFQSDLLDTNERQTFGINQYLIKTINDCVAVGTRVEWYQIADPTTDAVLNDTWNWTAGINYRQSANLTFRPEIRYDWYDGWQGLEDSFKFGVDAVMTF